MARAIHETTDCLLLTLPPELIDNICSYAVAQDGPIVAYVQTKCDQQTRHFHGKSRVIRSSKIYPEIPALAMTCQQLYEPVLKAFWMENTFLITLAAGHKGMIGWWSRVAPPSDFRSLASKRHQTIKSSLKHIILEFQAYDPVANVFGWGEVDLQMNKTGSIRTAFANALSNRCTCALEKQMEKDGGRLFPASCVLSWAIKFDIMALPLVYGCEKLHGMSEKRSCARCGKLRSCFEDRLT